MGYPVVGLQPGRIGTGFSGGKIVGAGGIGSGRVEMGRVRVGIRIWSDGGWIGEEEEVDSGRVWVRVVESGRMV